jgi:hypothetical protein
MTEPFCKTCNDSGFSGRGSGYDAVCSDCGGQSVHARSLSTRITSDDGDALSEDVLLDRKLVGSIWFDPDEPMFSKGDGTWFSRKLIAESACWAANAQQHQTREEAIAVFRLG